MPKKLSIYDIKILGDGIQLKKLIATQYGTIEEFVKNTWSIYTADQIKKISKRRIISNQKFKFYMSYALNMDCTEVFKTPQLQIQGYVDKLYDNFRLYNEKSDLEVINAVDKLCREYNAKPLCGKTNWIYGQICFNNGDLAAAIDYMKDAIDDSQIDSNLWTKFNSDLGLMHFINRDNEKAKIYYDKAKNKIMQKDMSFDKQIMFLNFYRTGLLYNSIGEHSEAIIELNEAMKHAASNYNNINVLMNLGVSYKKLNLFHEAIKFYSKAIQILDSEDKTSQARIFNNIAQVLVKSNNYYCAQKYIEYALRLHKNGSKNDIIVCANTYIEIMTLQGEFDDRVYELIEMIMEVHNISYNRRHILEAINAVISFGIKNNDYNVLKRTAEKIEVILKTLRYNNEYVKELKAYLCDIYLITGEVVYKTKE